MLVSRLDLKLFDLRYPDPLLFVIGLDPTIFSLSLEVVGIASLKCIAATLKAL